MFPETAFSVLLGMACLGALAPLLSRLMGRDAGYVLAAGFTAAALALGRLIPGVVEQGPLDAEITWFPALDISLALHLDGLALLFSLLILVIGAVVMAYSARYFRSDNPAGRVYTLLTLFATSMLGLVLADNVIALFVFWELTSITSFLLIGGKGGGRRAATRAFMVTGVGGLGLLAGLLLLGGISGTYSMQGILGEPETVRAAGPATWAMVLVLFGAFTKSAQFPFHFWLPGAMVAPTPISTYLHAATMVKAGIYLLARMSPLFAGEPAWTSAILLTGLTTAVIGAVLALKQHDLKALLAYSTVSQLGFMIAMVGIGTYEAMAGAAILIVAHALYKATLFMVVGIIDREAGSRDIRELSGLRKAMPVTAVVTGLAALSMAGIAPLLGFISKEETFVALLASPTGTPVDVLAAFLAIAASVMTFAYAGRVALRTFSGPLTQKLYEPELPFLAPAAVTAASGAVAGFVIGWFDPIINAFAEGATLVEKDFHAALWHGLTPALVASLFVIATGTVLIVLRRRVDRGLRKVTIGVTGAGVFDDLYERTIAVGQQAGKPFLDGAPSRHLGLVLGSAFVALTAAAVALGTTVGPSMAPSDPQDRFIVALIGIACLSLTRATNRLAATALLGLAGFLMAAFYVTLGAPDLALTQLLVETVTVALVVLVFRRLPRTFERVRRSRQLFAGGAAVIFGGAAGLAAHVLTGHRELSEAGAYYLNSGPEEAGGKNIVNTILVDFRALDTLGEITVLSVAALGVYILVKAGAARRGTGRDETS